MPLPLWPPFIQEKVISRFSSWKGVDDYEENDIVPMIT